MNFNVVSEPRLLGGEGSGDQLKTGTNRLIYLIHKAFDHFNNIYLHDILARFHFFRFSLFVAVAR